MAKNFQVKNACLIYHSHSIVVALHEQEWSGSIRDWERDKSSWPTGLSAWCTNMSSSGRMFFGIHAVPGQVGANFGSLQNACLNSWCGAKVDLSGVHNSSDPFINLPGTALRIWIPNATSVATLLPRHDLTWSENGKWKGCHAADENCRSKTFIAAKVTPPPAFRHV